LKIVTEEQRLKVKRTFHWAWVILGICFVNLFINYSVRLGYGVVLPEMIRTLGISRTAGGSITLKKTEVSRTTNA